MVLSQQRELFEKPLGGFYGAIKPWSEAVHIRHQLGRLERILSLSPKGGDACGQERGLGSIPLSTQ